MLWASQGRSPATAERAAAAGLTDVGTVAELSGRAGIIFSVCRSPRRQPASLATTAPGDLVELVVEAVREP